MIFIAEIKTKCPFNLNDVPNVTFDALKESAINYGDMISVHVESPWGGKPSDINRVRRSGARQKIIAKGIHPTDEHIEQSLNFGADIVLVVGRVPRKSLLPYCWLEPLNVVQARYFTEVCQTLVWNSRCMQTGGTKKEQWDEVRSIHSGQLIQASNIRTLADVKEDADGILVGTHLIEFIKAAGLKVKRQFGPTSWQLLVRRTINDYAKYQSPLFYDIGIV